jgi:uncharacterized protein (TIGR00730 family)
MKQICVFCGSSFGKDDRYRQATVALGHTLAQQGRTLIWGGGKVGLMGTIADAVLELGGETIGVIPEFMVERELAHEGSTELIEVVSMHTRKAVMAEHADGFIALPGGFGTLDELFEILTWAQLRIHSKPVGLLNVAGYFDPLLQWVDRAVAEGFVRAEHRHAFYVSDEPAALLAMMDAHVAPQGDWLGKVEIAQS